MIHELLDKFESEDGQIQVAFYREPETGKGRAWLSVGQAGLTIPTELVGDFFEAAELIRDYLAELEDDDE